jgi:hypothetical protein
MSPADMEKAIKETIASVGAAGIKDMGRVMAALKEKYAGQLDPGQASQAVKKLLSV